jgi:hypothetical protein
VNVAGCGSCFKTVRRGATLATSRSACNRVRDIRHVVRRVRWTSLLLAARAMSGSLPLARIVLVKPLPSPRRRANRALAASLLAARASRGESAGVVVARRGRTPRLPPCPLLAALAEAGARFPRLMARSARRVSRLGAAMFVVARGQRSVSAPSSSARRRANRALAASLLAARASRGESAGVVVARRGRTPRLPPCPLLAALAEAGA